MSGLAFDVRRTMDEIEPRLEFLAKERGAAAARALNRTMTTVRAEAARRLKVEYPGVKIGNLKARMKLSRATAQNPVAAITFSGGRFQLYGNFNMRTSGRWGVRFGKLPWRLETVSGAPVDAGMLARAFRQRARRGGRAYVFARHTPARESFEILLAPGLARAVTERAILGELRRSGLARFAIVYAQEAKFRLGG